MSILAVVPARGGSKGIKYKNIMDINGRPLIYYVLHELLKSTVNQVVVSTDDAKIKQTVKKFFGDDVYILDRPESISDDFATSESVIKHALGKIGGHSYTMLVQCTSPLTEAGDFNRLVKTIKRRNFNSAAFYVEDDNLFFDDKDDMKLLNSERLPRQGRKLKRKEVGNAWIFETDGFLKYGSRLFGRIGLCKIIPPKDLEIDNIGDVDVIKYILLNRPISKEHWVPIGSPHLNIIDIQRVAKKHIIEYIKNHRNVSVLNVGGGISAKRNKKPTWYRDLAAYRVLDIDETISANYVIHGDICDCPQIRDNTYDIVYSSAVFEHIEKPWLAAKECVRITKPGGLNIHRAPFGARYHPVPVDCFRYTHTGMKVLFEDLEEVLSGYDVHNRRADKRGSEEHGGIDMAPVDAMGGWRENWMVLYIGKK